VNLKLAAMNLTATAAHPLAGAGANPPLARPKQAVTFTGQLAVESPADAYSLPASPAAHKKGAASPKQQAKQLAQAPQHAQHQAQHVQHGGDTYSHGMCLKQAAAILCNKPQAALGGYAAAGYCWPAEGQPAGPALKAEAALLLSRPAGGGAAADAAAAAPSPWGAGPQGQARAAAFAAAAMRAAAAIDGRGAVAAAAGHEIECDDGSDHEGTWEAADGMQRHHQMGRRGPGQGDRVDERFVRQILEELSVAGGLSRRASLAAPLGQQQSSVMLPAAAAPPTSAAKERQSRRAARQAEEAAKKEEKKAAKAAAKAAKAAAKAARRQPAASSSSATGAERVTAEVRTAATSTTGKSGFFHPWWWGASGSELQSRGQSEPSSVNHWRSRPSMLCCSDVGGGSEDGGEAAQGEKKGWGKRALKALKKAFCCGEPAVVTSPSFSSEGSSVWSGQSRYY
jgi:hypothetical protein